MRRIAHSVWFRLAWSIGCTLLLALAGRAETRGKPPATAKLIDLEVSVRQLDPFSDENQVGAAAKPLPVGARTGPFRRGTTFTLMIVGKPKPGYHTYPLTQRSSDPVQSEDYLTNLVYQPSPGLKPLWPRMESPAPEFVAERNLGVFLEYAHPFTWSQDILVLPEAKPGAHTLAFSLEIQVCNENGCTSGVHPFSVPIEVSPAPPLPPSRALEARLEAKRQVTIVSVPPALRNSTSTAIKSRSASPGSAASDSNQANVEAARKEDRGLLALLLLSMGSAAAMLLTPCVFPMIPITVSFFLKQSEKKHHNALLSAAVYSGTIIVIMSLAVLVLGSLIIRLADSTWTNLGIGLLLVFFALSLFGMYEIELPHFLSRFTSAHEGSGGYLGTMFMALTFTITSFTCTGPFLGPLLATTAAVRFSYRELVLAAVTYSATFAAPFFVMALFPTLLKQLPRSGSWLNSVKVVMGFLELAAALKFLAIVDISWTQGNPWFFTYETVLIAWIVLAVACGLYLLNVYRLPHDTPAESIGVSRMLFGTLFLGLAIYLTPALSRKIPQGIVGLKLVQFLPLDTARVAESGSAGPGGAEANELTWYLNYEEAWKKATAEGKDLFLDFTGVTCQICQANEATVFPDARVQAALKKYVRVKLYCDTVPDPKLRGDAKAAALRNLELEDKTFGDQTRPLYVIFRPARDEAIQDGKLKGQTLGTRGGALGDAGDFASFLRSPQSRRVAQGN